jgi:hypothetical protein
MRQACPNDELTLLLVVICFLRSHFDKLLWREKMEFVILGFAGAVDIALVVLPLARPSCNDALHDNCFLHEHIRIIAIYSINLILILLLVPYHCFITFMIKRCSCLQSRGFCSLHMSSPDSSRLVVPRHIHTFEISSVRSLGQICACIFPSSRS